MPRLQEDAKLKTISGSIAGLSFVALLQFAALDPTQCDGVREPTTLLFIVSMITGIYLFLFPYRTDSKSYEREGQTRWFYRIHSFVASICVLTFILAGLGLVLMVAPNFVFVVFGLGVLVLLLLTHLVLRELVSDRDQKDRVRDSGRD